MSHIDYLSAILERKQREITLRQRHEAHILQGVEGHEARGRATFAYAALRRPRGAPARVIAEIKRRSPSAGALRARTQGDVEFLAQEYLRGGAFALSVLCDGKGFGGSVLDVRRAARAVSLPILFKEFVLEELQIQLASRMGAHMVLLVVRALSHERLHQLCETALRLGLAPLVEAADAGEVEVALSTQAKIIGVNARNLETFEVDTRAADLALKSIPPSRIAVHMSGIRNARDYRRVCAGRADAVLIGETLMRAERPAHKLRELQAPEPPVVFEVESEARLSQV
jgi:indole-3-glycerol phosphate synthase